MITLKKLSTLKEGTRLRKIAALLRGSVDDLAQGRQVDLVFLCGLGALLGGVESLSKELKDQGVRLASGDIPGEASEFLRYLDNLYYRLSGELGVSPGDWDLRDHRTGDFDEAQRRSLPMSVYLEDLRSPFNVGSVFRSAEAFGARDILLSPGTPSPEHPRTRRTAMGCDEILPWEVAPLDELEGRPGIFILELGGTPLDEFEFPREGMVILGSEELGVSPRAAELAEAGAGRVSIPLVGSKGSLNVSVAFGILIQAWSHSLINLQ